MRIVPKGPNGPNDAAGTPQTVFYHRCTIDLAREAINIDDVPCRNLEEVLGGFGRSFQYLATRDVSDAFASENPMVVNTGLLTGSNVMTGLRTYFSAYSPLKVSNRGLPAAMWSAASGKFGSKLKWTGLDELILENKSDRPVVIVIRESADGPQVASLYHVARLHESLERWEEAEFAAGLLLELTPEDAEEYAEREELLERILEAQANGE